LRERCDALIFPPLKIARAFWLQILLVVVIIGAAVALWHFLPIADALGVIQQRVMRDLLSDSLRLL
jgi:hypothetical protein